MAKRSRRSDVFHHNEVGVAHCVQRCVRRAFLAGKDPVTGKTYEYRRDWIRKRMELLASVFGLDVLTYAVMSNHLHVMLRTRPDVVKTWNDEEIARRWLRLFPGRRLEDFLGEPTKQDIANAIGNSKKIAEWRKRLSDISWFMRALAEPIARKANKEDKCTGRFWEGRFKAQKIVDEAGLLACAMYVDLNPVRAAIAKSPEQSKFTSAYDRIMSELGNRSVPAVRELDAKKEDAATLRKKLEAAIRKNDREEMADLKKRLSEATAAESSSGVSGKLARKPERNDAWLSVLELQERSHLGPVPHTQGIRASDKGFLPMKLSEYITLLDWTGREGREGKKGSIPKELAPILERIGIDGSMWCDLVWRYSKYFGKSKAVGSPEKLKSEARHRGIAYIRGQVQCKECFLT